MSDLMVRAAVAYAEQLRWPVFPVHSITDAGRCTCGRPGCENLAKHPRTLHGFYDATTDTSVITRWWRDWPTANIGIRTGDGRVGLDVDPGRGGDESLHALAREHGEVPLTPRQRTGGGGWHLIFHSAGASVANAVDLFPGLDVRGDNGYLVVAPSLHRSGRRYSWELDALPTTTPLAPIPPWLLARIVAGREPRPQRDGTPLLLTVGARNDRLFRLGCMLRRYGCCESTIRDALVAANRDHCKPPLEQSEVAKIAASASRYTPQDRRSVKVKVL